MERSDKGKYLVVVVAIIGAIATISVPIVNHYFPTPKTEDPVKTLPAASPSVSAETVQAGADSGPKSTPPEIKHVIPPPGEDGSLDLQNVQRHLAEGDQAAAYRTALYLVSAATDNPQFHACLADLSISQGLMSRAADEFKKSADLGLDGMSVREARVRENLPVLTAGYLYVPGTEFGTEQAILLNNLRDAGIPGTYPFREKLCRDAKKTVEDQESLPSNQKLFAPGSVNRRCASDPDPAMQFTDCYR